MDYRFLCPWNSPGVPSSRGSSRPRDLSRASSVSCLGKRVLYHSCHLGSHNCYTQSHMNCYTGLLIINHRGGTLWKQTFKSITTGDAVVTHAQDPTLSQLRAQAQSPVRELKSHKPRGEAKKKKKNEIKNS